MVYPDKIFLDFLKVNISFFSFTLYPSPFEHCLFYMNTTRFLFLDALRGIGSIYVAIFHFYTILKDKTDFTFPKVIDFILLQGSIGMQTFFILSGFVIAYSVYNQKISFRFLGQFFIRRSIRIDPPYWIALFLTILTTLFSVIFFTKPADELPKGAEVVANLFYLQDFLHMERIVHVSWTLCLEIQLYLFFVAFTGFLSWVHKICKMQTTEKILDSGLFVLMFGILFLFSLSQNLPLSPFFPNGLFIPYWYSFFMGSMLCWVHLKVVNAGYFAIYCLLLAIFFLIEPLRQVGETLIISLLIYGVSYKNKLFTALGFQPFQYLGKISYSLYLTHWLFAGKLIDALARRYGDGIDLALGTGLMFVSLAVALMTAHFFYHWVEFPSLRWSKMFKQKTVAKLSPT